MNSDPGRARLVFTVPSVEIRLIVLRYSIVKAEQQEVGAAVGIAAGELNSARKTVGSGISSGVLTSRRLIIEIEDPGRKVSRRYLRRTMIGRQEEWCVIIERIIEQ